MSRVLLRYCVAWSWRCSFIGSNWVSSCRCCIFVSVMQPVAMRSALFCMIWSLLMFVCEMIGDHVCDAYSRMGRVMALYVATIVSFCLPQLVDVSACSIVIILRALSHVFRKWGVKMCCVSKVTPRILLLFVVLIGIPSM